MRDKSVILIVDDQLQNIELLEAYLVHQGYEILTATSGAETFEKMASNEIDLVLLDVMMPDMDGFEVTRRIRKNDDTQHLPIILVTALQCSEDRINGIEAGCDDFISKPFDKTELQARVRAMLKVKAYNDLIHDYHKELETQVNLRTEELRLALESIQAASLETIQRLAIASEYKDTGTGAHIQRMSLYSAAISHFMRLEDRTTELILYAAPMHDLGKVGIPDTILLKPAKLDETEWEIMKLHPVIGAEILKGSTAEFIQVGEIIAKYHHEKWDGSGYPYGLKGEEIPIICRIVAAADVFDALTSQRPYKKAYSVETAMAIITKGKGSHFDPAVVDALTAIQDEILYIKNQSDQSHLQVNNLLQVKTILKQYIDAKL